MGVLESAANMGKPIDPSIIPDGTKKVEARGDASGWALVFTTDAGEVVVPVENMKRAVSLANRLAARIGK